MNKLLGVAAAVIASLPLLASPAQADVVGYEGIIRASDGTPIAGAQLAVYPSEADTPGAPAATFTADADGHYLINGLDTSKTYKIETSAAGYRPQWWYRAPDFSNATAVWIPSNTVVEEDVTLGTG